MSNSRRTQRRYESRQKADQYRAQHSRPLQAPLGECRHIERRHREKQAEPWHRDPGHDILTGLDWIKKQMADFQKKQRGTP
jgi:hypothetical protein